MLYSMSFDIGGSTTKIILYDGENIIYKGIVPGSNPLDSFDHALDLVTTSCSDVLKNIKTIYVTGAGASFFNDVHKGYKIVKVPEYEATATGGLYLANRKEAIVISMGTGTAFYSVKDGKTTHVIGTGVGGGSISGLSKLLFNKEQIDEVDKLALSGSTTEVDLTIGDISNGDMPGLPVDLTAANFGKIRKLDNAKEEDIAAGMFNMVFQTIGTISVMVSNITGQKDIVLTGQVSTLKSCRKVLDDFENFYNVKFTIPENSSYATAIGACLIGK